AVFATTGFALSFAATARLITYSRLRSLQKRGHVAQATGGFGWNPRRAGYEPVLKFVTPTGEHRQKILTPSFDLNRLPTAHTLTALADPRGPASGELSDEGARPVRRTRAVLTAVGVVFLFLAALPPYLLVGPPGQLARTSLATGLALGGVAALVRALWR